MVVCCELSFLLVTILIIIMAKLKLIGTETQKQEEPYAKTSFLSF